MMAKMISMQVAVPILLLLVPKQKDKTPFFLSPGQHNAGQDQEIQAFSEGSRYNSERAIYIIKY